MDNLYIVTGANGHLGNTIIRDLRNEAKNVRALILKNDNDKLLKSLGAQIVYGDVRDEKTLDELFENKENRNLYVIHAAGIVSITRKKNKLLYDVNVNGTKLITDYALKNNVEKFIYVSSVHAIPEKPNNETIKEVKYFDYNIVVDDYAKSKAIASNYVIEKINEGLNGLIVHPSGIIGPYDYGRAHMTMMIEEYMNGYLTSRVDGAYDFVDVRDVSKGIISALYKGRIGETYILSGHRVHLKEMFEILQKLSGRKRKINVLPKWFAKLAAPLAELFYRIRKLPPIYTNYSLYTLDSNSHFSNEKARENLDYSPRALKETLFDTTYFLKEQKRIKNKRVLLKMKKLDRKTF